MVSKLILFNKNKKNKKNRNSVVGRSLPNKVPRVHDLNISANEISDKLEEIAAWAHQWKMSFNSDSLKHAHEVIYSRKSNKLHHPDCNFNGNPVKKSSDQKYLGMFLDGKLDFDEHIKGAFDKTSKSR